MPARRIRWTLWLTFLLTIPLPCFMIGMGRVPVVGLLAFAALTGAAALADPDFASRFLSLAFAVQAAFFAAVLYLFAGLAARALGRLGAATGRRLLWLLVGVCFALSLLPIYVTPLSSAGPRANLFGIFD